MIEADDEPKDSAEIATFLDKNIPSEQREDLNNQQIPDAQQLNLLRLKKRPPYLTPGRDGIEYYVREWTRLRFVAWLVQKGHLSEETKTAVQRFRESLAYRRRGRLTQVPKPSVEDRQRILQKRARIKARISAQQLALPLELSTENQSPFERTSRRYARWIINADQLREQMLNDPHTPGPNLQPPLFKE